MGRRGRNRDKRDEVMALIEAADPALHAELVELRAISPPQYRKHLRHWVQYYPISSSPQRVMANRGAKWKGQGVDTWDVLELPFQTARQAIVAGNFDDRLDELGARETAGKNRPLMHQFIAQRRASIAAPIVPSELPRVGSGWGQKQRSDVDETAVTPPPSSRWADGD